MRVAAPPVDGAANDALIAYLADAFHIPKRAIQIVGGDHGRRKRVAMAGVTAEQVRLTFSATASEPPKKHDV